jgi:acetyl-CoA carboxylase beta subunit
MVFHNDLEENHFVIPASGYHMKMSAEARLKHIFDDGKYELLPSPKVPQDPLKFRDSKKYTDRLRENRTKTGLEDSVVAGTARCAVSTSLPASMIFPSWAVRSALPQARRSSRRLKLRSNANARW